MSGTSDSNDILTYKGKPLLRKDNTIYYGSMSDKFIIHMEITDTKKVDDLDVATKVNIYLQSTNQNLKVKDQIIKKSEKDNLYSAMDIAVVWLERALAK